MTTINKKISPAVHEYLPSLQCYKLAMLEYINNLHINIQYGFQKKILRWKHGKK